jgi:hypothetical protein
MLLSAALKGRLALAAGGIAAAALAIGALRADLFVTQQFTQALSRQGLANLDPHAGPRVAGAQSGDEGYWLTRSEVASPSPFDKQLTVGDRITIAGRDGRARTLEVVDIKIVGEPLVPAVAGSAPPRLLMVTCHVIAAEGETEVKAPVRFIIEAETPEPTPARAPTSPKA